MECGTPPEIIFGYHSGWDFERLVELFEYHKRREIERNRDLANLFALGAGSILGGKGLKEFNEKVQDSVSGYRKQTKSEMTAEISKLMGIVGGL